jgi:hypothetical protein
MQFTCCVIVVDRPESKWLDETKREVSVDLLLPGDVADEHPVAVLVLVRGHVLVGAAH